MPKWLLKIAISFAKDPERGSKTIFYIIGSVIVIMMLCSTLSMNMIGTFLNQKDANDSVLINSEYDTESTKMFKDIKSVYDQFSKDMIEKMDKREAKIIEENTTYITVEKELPSGKVVYEQQPVCNVTVTKSWNDFSLSYIFAYINHTSDVKYNIDYKFNKKEIYEICEKICTLKEDVSGTNYSLYTVVITPEDAAKLFYPEEDKQEMYVVSYYLYDDFLAYTSNYYASAGSKIDTDGTGTSASGVTGTKANGNASEKLKALFPDGLPQSEAEMQKYLTTITVETIDKQGNVVKRNLTVHKALAQDVLEIFAEIKAAGFAAYDVGAYTWRSMAASGNRSHHSYGVAIDINPNENYMIKNGRVVAGSCWNPSSNQYSIGPDSAVVRAFQKRGWIWGGTWNSSKDYMHFSYTGY